jgi:penicillin amidase
LSSPEDGRQVQTLKSEGRGNPDILTRNEWEDVIADHGPDFSAPQSALDLLASSDFAAAFNGSIDQDQYRWGRLHRIVFAHPLDGPFSAPPAGGDFPPPLSDLPGIPVDGAFGTVDVARHDIRAADANAFTFFEGPAKRFVASVPPGRLRAETSLPSGESGVVGDPHYVDLLEPWLVNDSFPLLTNPGEISGEASATERFVPAVHAGN